MASLRKNFRRWWQPPRRTIDREEDRSVTFLELFYDLVYVVLVAEIAHTLSTHVGWEGVISFVAMFALVWLAWFNGTLYHDLHGNDDFRTRVFTFLQMFTVVAMAVFAHGALGETSVGFALSFVAYQIILTYLWWRTGVHDPDHRPLAQPYALVFLISVLIFVGSVFVPPPWRFYMWAVALLISLVIPLINLSLQPDDPRIQAELDRTFTITPSAVERFGLFTIIVLGEVIVAVVRGVAGQHHLTWTVGITAALGMLVAIGLWWLYFDFISQHIPKIQRSKVAIWMYFHLFMTMGIVAAGAAMLNVVEHTGEHLPAEVRWLLVGAIALALICIAQLIRSIQIPDEHIQIYRTAGIVTFVSGIIILLLGFSNLAAIPLLIILLLLLLAPVFYSLKVWIQVLGAEEIEL